MALFSSKSRRQIGIDIGTSSIKVVELSRRGSRFQLENYGLVRGLDLVANSDSGERGVSSLKLSEDEIAAGLKKLLEVSKIKTRKAVLSVPVFSSFLTVIDLPSMKMEELENAVPIQARSYIPVPLSEVAIDWLVIPQRGQRSSIPTDSKSNNQNSESPPKEKKIIKENDSLSVLLIAVPKEVITKFQRIARQSEISLSAMESESFSAIRSLVGNDLMPTILIDFGARSTTLTLVDQGFVRMNHTLDLAGREITHVISQGLNVSIDRAEEIKKSTGIVSKEGKGEGIAPIVRPLLGRLVSQFNKMTEVYLSKQGQKVQKIILTGGSSQLPGLVDYLKNELSVEVTVGNPFARIDFPKELSEIVSGDLAPSLTVATGAAMRNFK